MLSIFFLVSGCFCFGLAFRGILSGPLWIDSTDSIVELKAEPIRGNPARVLGIVYLATGVGCIVAAFTAIRA
jgi:hypothetical protein